MPSVPKYNKCSELGCLNERSRLNSFCKDHGGINTYTSAKRTEHKALYNTKAWRAIRLRQLSEHPLCEACAINGQVAIATDVDHLFAWSQIGKEAFTFNIFQSLCHEHHAYKTGLEKNGIYRRFTNPPIDYEITDYRHTVARFFMKTK